MLGKRFSTVWDLEQAWHEYTNRTEIKLNSEFLLHDRQQESKLLLELVSNNRAVHRVKASSRAEAYGFVLSTLIGNEIANSKCLIIKSQESWDSMATSDQNLILIPYGFLPTGIGSAVSNNHTVVVVVDDKDNHASSMKLTRQPRLTREDALRKLGFDDDVVNILYQDTKGYLDPLLRHSLLKPIDYLTPTWPDNFPTEVLFAAFFASEWNENNAHDKEILEILSALPYIEFQNHIIKLSKVDDAPIRLVGDVWQIISKMDYWLLIASKIARPHVNRLGEIIPSIFSDNDPSYDLSPEERYMASIKGAVPKYSNLLKRSIADSLVLLSTYGDDISNQLGGESISSNISFWIREVYKKNNHVKFWFSLGECTRLLAEASPEEFICAVETATAGNSPVLLGLFEVEGDGVFGGCYHSNLLWGLELISWNKQYLTRVSLCLARLSEIDPGGKWSNRPFNSLVDIYLGWINNTSASHEDRLRIIDQVLIRQYPEIAWRLMIALLMNNSKTTSGLCKPEYRDWSKDIIRHTTHKEYLDYVTSIVDMLLKEIEKNIEDRILDLIDNFDSFNELQQNLVIERLLNIDVNDINDRARSNMLKKLRSILSNHREFPTANWVWPEVLLNRLEEVYMKLDFSDIVKSNVYLFNDHWPNLIEPIKRKEATYEERNEILLNKRILALEDIYKSLAEDGLARLVSECTIAGLVGQTAFSSSLSKNFEKTAVGWLEKCDQRVDFSEGYFRSLSFNDFNRAKEVLNSNDDWPDNLKAKYLLCFPLRRETLDLIDHISIDGKNLFWSKLNNYFTSDRDVSFISYIALSLLENDRPLAAVDVIAQIFHGRLDLTALDSKLVYDILIRIATTPSDAEEISISNVSYEILKCIEFLQDAGSISEEDIRQIEWAYLKIFRFEKFSPRYLMESIAEDPDFFSQLVIWVFKRSDNKEDPSEDLDKELIKQRADIAWELLDTVSVLPGGKGNQIDGYVLSEWISEVRHRLSSVGRAKIGDDMIGKLLSHSPIGIDDIWPHESVRSAIEHYKSNEMDQAIIVGRRNSRGVTSRHPYSGGDQERALAQKYYEDAQSIQLIYPRTAEILNSIAKRYEWDANREDIDVELRD